MKVSEDNCLGSTLLCTHTYLWSKKPYSSGNELYNATNRAQSFVNTTVTWVSFQESFGIVLLINFYGVLGQQWHSNKYPLQSPHTFKFSTPYIFPNEQHRKVIDNTGLYMFSNSEIVMVSHI